MEVDVKLSRRLESKINKTSKANRQISAPLLL